MLKVKIEQKFLEEYLIQIFIVISLFKLKETNVKESEEKLSSLKTAFITNSKILDGQKDTDLVNIESEKELNQIYVKDILKKD